MRKSTSCLVDGRDWSSNNTVAICRGFDRFWLSSPFVVEVKRSRVKQSPPGTSPLQSAARRMAARAPSIGSTCSPLRRKKVIWRLPADLAHSKEGFGCRQARTVVHRRTNRTPLHTMAKKSTDEDKLTSVRCVRKLHPVYFQRGICAEISVALKIRALLSFPLALPNVHR